MITNYKKFNENIKSLLVGPTKDEMKDYWKDLGYDQSFETPEEFFLYIIDGIKIKEQTEYPNSILWEKNDEIIFDQNLKFKYLFVNSKLIWSVFRNVFGLNYDEIQSFIKNQVEEHLNWKGFTPHSGWLSNKGKVEEHLNWKGFTPFYITEIYLEWVGKQKGDYKYNHLFYFTLLPFQFLSV